jgi:hypothetical protein
MKIKILSATDEEVRKFDYFLRTLILFCYVWRNKEASQDLKNVLVKYFSYVDTAPFKIQKQKVEMIVNMIVKDHIKSELLKRQLLELGKSIAVVQKMIDKDNSYSRSMLDSITKIGTYLRSLDKDRYEGKGSDSAYEQIEKLSASFDNELLKVFKTNLSDKHVGFTEEGLKEIIFQLTEKKDSLSISRARSKELKLQQPELYQKYLTTRLGVRKMYDNFLNNFLRANANQKYEPKYLAKVLKDNRMPNFLPSGFVGLIGINKQNKITLYTKTGREIRGNPDPDAEIVMNPNYNVEEDDQYVFKMLHPENVSEVMFYTVDYKKKAVTEKFKVVDDVIDNFAVFEKKIENSIMKGKVWFDDVGPALICHLIAETGARIGSASGKTDGKTTYGISSILCRHIRLNQNSITFDYPGKKNVRQIHKYKIVGKVRERAAELLLYAKKKKLEGEWFDKKPSELLFTDRAGNKRISDAMVRKYLQEIGFPGTPHKLRHAKGTTVLKSLLEKNKFRSGTQGQAEEYFKKQLEEVAKVLGHQSADGKALWSTSSESYCNPYIQKNWFSERGYRIPRWLEKVKTEED